MIKNNYPGKFIVLEGLDGSGKSTQAKNFAQYLKQQKQPAFVTCQPSQFLIGGIVRSCLLGDWQSPPECLQLLFDADTFYRLDKEIIPLLQKGVTVISDRYNIFSSLAYGAVGCSWEWLIDVNRIFPIPDLTIFLDINVKTALQRISSERGSVELYEKEDILNQVSKNYLKVIETYRDKGAKIAIVNGNENQEAVFENIKKIYEQNFG